MENLSNLFKLLSDETRIRILMLLFQSPMCVCDLSFIMKESQPKISKHIAKLRDLDFITGKKSEQYILYSLNKNNLLLIKILNYIFLNLNSYDQLEKDYNFFNSKENSLKFCSIKKIN
ncbi:MAG: ArsR family transcriptional regulator, arsenate/arsenite/antimonite-responsive transcriptional [Oceanotoga sp.]|jgi:ArsR family transcriptional regulator|uniref:ArsR family transcriptional regulator n=1 Tax=Oceanotoga teriensis TaxID=515440 RepID=A0AA45C7W1_9BACT|nr:MULTISPECIES: metalloregulator ArsR/SmtB family transcription factor [Oceanotoga]MDN5342520.1 ArsR family transcriptional regulator, arsenate/arsenite/antimonite-responsive transcriptional [Oceanotoga sp.]PWJ95655.1 ArsR family transcriptional regulator [Oceanotoga teriensis]